MANRIQKSMLPECEIYKISLHEGTFHTFFTLYFSYLFILFLNTEKDGQQVLIFYWTDPIEAMKRYLARRKYKTKFYTHFKPQFVGKQRAFSKANSGMVFEAAQLIDINSSPVLALFYADASFAGQHMTHHPIYSKQYITAIILIIFNY